MKLLVTGGSGFLGRRVVTSALDRGYQVTVLVRSDKADDTVRRLGAGTVRGDLDHPASVEAAFRTVAANTLLSIASLGTGHAPTIVAGAESAGLRRAVFLSTTGIFTTLDPPSKRVRTAAEETIRASDLDWTIIRPTMIYGGPDDRNMCRLLGLLRHCPVIPVPGGARHLQQPVHVDDLADVVLRALTTEAAVRRSYDIAGPAALTFREIILTAGDAVGRRVVCVPVPVGPARSLVGAYERRVDRPWLKAEQISRLVEDKCFPIDDARRDLGFAPRTFADGIRAQAGLRPAGLDGVRTRRAGRPPTPAASPAPSALGALTSELRGIGAVAGRRAALRFAGAVAANARAIISTGALTAADSAMAGRDWMFRPLDNMEIVLSGTAFGGARRMYCRGVCSALPGYTPRPGEVIVDLGAGQGLFSVLAAKAGADVIAVETRPEFVSAFTRHAQLNDVSHRIQLLHALVDARPRGLSGSTPRGTAMNGTGEVQRLRLTEVFEHGGVDHIDLIRITLGGSEFAVFDEPDWLAAVDRIVVEVHPAFGSPKTLTAVLEHHGFDTVLLDSMSRVTTDLGNAPSGYLHARRRNLVTASPRAAERIETESTTEVLA